MSGIRRISRRVRFTLVALVTLIVVGLGAVAARAVTGGSAGRYRTAVAELGSVTETLATSGTVDATQRQDVAVAVAGTVSKVSVETGDKVKDGQVLVTLDRSSAERALRKAKATLAQAKADLESAENAQAQVVEQANSSLKQSAPSGQPSKPSGGPSSPTGGPSSPTGGPSSPTGGPTTPTGGPTTPDPLPKVTLPSVAELRCLQVRTAQTATSTALADAKAALAHQTKVCAQALTSTGDGQGTNDDAVTGDSRPVTTACQRALDAVQGAQQTVANKQAALQQATGALTDALVAAVQQTSDGIAALQAWINAHSSGKGYVATPTTHRECATCRNENPLRQVVHSRLPPDSSTHAVSAVYVVPADSTTTATTTAATVATVATGDAAGAAGASAQSIASAQAAIDAAEAGLIQAEQTSLPLG